MRMRGDAGEDPNDRGADGADKGQRRRGNGQILSSTHLGTSFALYASGMKFHLMEV